MEIVSIEKKTFFGAPKALFMQRHKFCPIEQRTEGAIQARKGKAGAHIANDDKLWLLFIHINAGEL